MAHPKSRALTIDRNTQTMPGNEKAEHHEPTAIDEDWQVVTRSSETASESSNDAQKQESREQSQGPFLPLTEEVRSASSLPQTYASKLRSGLPEREAATTAMNELTTSVKAQSTDLASAVKKLNQERELLAKERKRLQDKNITEKAEIHAQLHRQVIAMHQSIMAKNEEERVKLHDQLKAAFDADLERMAKDVQAALDVEAKTRRSLLEELNDRVKETKKALEMRVSAVYQQVRSLQQQVSDIDQRVSAIDLYLRPSSQERERRPTSVQQERTQQSRSTDPAPRSRMDVNAANAAARRQRAEGPERAPAVSQATQRAHAMHVARGQFDYDCELCA